jgi:L-lactate utilization protein LutC
LNAIDGNNLESSSRARDPLEEFSERFTKQSGVFYPAKNSNEVVSTINDLIRERGRGDSCAAPISLMENGLPVDISKEIRTTVPFDDFLKNPREVSAKIDVGITRANYAVAETGSIVDISLSDQHRLLSSFSRVHIAFLDRSAVLTRLSELAPKIRDLLNADTGETKPSISLIGGPSRTSDIELKSVLGVHGPHEVHVVVL